LIFDRVFWSNCPLEGLLYVVAELPRIASEVFARPFAVLAFNAFNLAHFVRSQLTCFALQTASNGCDQGHQLAKETLVISSLHGAVTLLAAA